MSDCKQGPAGVSKPGGKWKVGQTNRLYRRTIERLTDVKERFRVEVFSVSLDTLIIPNWKATLPSTNSAYCPEAVTLNTCIVAILLVQKCGPIAWATRMFFYLATEVLYVILRNNSNRSTAYILLQYTTSVIYRECEFKDLIQPARDLSDVQWLRVVLTIDVLDCILHELLCKTICAIWW